MKLLISREQRQDKKGVVSFAMVVRADLSAEEKAAITKYGLGAQVLFQTPEPEELMEKRGFLSSILSAQPDLWNQPLKVTSLEGGAHFQYGTVAEAQQVEQAIRTAVKEFKHMLDAAVGFGGEEVIEV